MFHVSLKYIFHNIIKSWCRTVTWWKRKIICEVRLFLFFFFQKMFFSIVFFFFVFLIFNFISPNVCHWDMFFWRGATEFSCLSDRFLCLSRKLVSATVFLPKFFSPLAGWLIYELHLGILFSLKKQSERHHLVTVVSLRQFFEWKRNSQMSLQINQLAAGEKFSAKIRSLW